MSDTRKVIIELKTNSQFKQAQRKIFEKVESVEGLELFKIDFLRNYTLMLTEIKMKPGYSINEAGLSPEAEILSILENKDKTYTVLMKLRPYIELDSIVKEFDINVIWDSPLKVTEDRRIYSAIADEENMDKLLSAIQRVGKIEKTRAVKKSTKEYNASKLISKSANKLSSGVDKSRLTVATVDQKLEGHSTSAVSSNIQVAKSSPISGSGGNSAGSAERTREEIETIFQKYKGAFYSMYNRALRKDPTIQGRVIVELTITPSGSVTAAKIVSSALNNKTLERKIIARVK
ncbi:MAG: AgmX/PglI C-terminal domain-containing protein, partial [Candidatus Lokiarchaeota archaeon]